MRDSDRNPLAPQIGSIAVRFHPYWAGSDRDGEVAGFYFAVVETLPIPPPGLTTLPPLPGPKPQDYRFTNKTDSTFIFRVSQASQDRQHAFYIYAVDNHGKADATPARVIFNSIDRYPPLPVIDFARGAGPIYRVRPGGIVVQSDTSVAITDSLTRDNFSEEPAETVPSTARLEFRWHGEPTIAGTYVTGYRYKLDEPSFVDVDASVTSVTYNTGVAGDVITPGIKVFTLQAVDQAEGVRTTTRRFRMNFIPTAWFSGPDSNLYPRVLPPAGTGERYVTVPNWQVRPTFPGSLLSCDSLLLWPGERPDMKTFFEIHDPDGSGPLPDRVYVRSENDTVNMNSWVIVHSGGADLDSPYGVDVSPNDPALPTAALCGAPPKVLQPGPANGSPVAFRKRVTAALSFGTNPVPPSVESPYPVYDPSNFLRTTLIAAYGEMSQSGRIYFETRSQDTEGGNGEDKRINDPIGIVRRVENGTASPLDIELRKRILTFYVNKRPELLLTHSNFQPKPGHTYATRQLELRLLADDRDPLDPETNVGTGQPSTAKILRWRVWISGRNASNDPVTQLVTPEPVYSGNMTVFLDPQITSTSDTVKVEICDCAECETRPGLGRCAELYRIPITVPPPSPNALPTSAPSVEQGPGLSRQAKRSPQP